jgi:hypothetical protein
MILYDFRLWPGVKSQGHTTADSQPVIPSWLRAPNWDSGLILAFKESVVFVCRGASTVMGGRTCHIKEPCVCLYIIF